jgi:phage shock protein PspC (stress-responsive transcriptional regulator)
MAESYKRLYRSNDDRMIAGVCGGLGDYFQVDPTLIRLLFVAGFFVSGSGLFWIYLIMMIIVPEEVPAAQQTISGKVQEASED